MFQALPVLRKAFLAAAMLLTASAQCFAANGRYSVVDGKITDPSGAPFVARGINLFDNQLSCCFATASTLFPKANFIRLAFQHYLPPADFASYVERATSAGLVVVLEDHTSTAQVYVGAQLVDELLWFRKIARAFKDNPRVWFGTLNEPDIDYYNNPPLRTYAELIGQQRKIYNTIRGAGNLNPILMEVRGGWYAYPTTAFARTFSTMTNIIWDLHFYGWVSKFSRNQAEVNKALLGVLSGDNYGGAIIMQDRVRSADGVVPVIFGEHGPSTFGVVCDPNYHQVMVAAQNAGALYGFGAAAWHYAAGANALVAGTSLTNFGREVANWQNTGVASAFSPCP